MQDELLSIQKNALKEVQLKALVVYLISCTSKSLSTY